MLGEELLHTGAPGGDEAGAVAQPLRQRGGHLLHEQLGALAPTSAAPEDADDASAALASDGLPELLGGGRELQRPPQPLRLPPGRRAPGHPLDPSRGSLLLADAVLQQVKPCLQTFYGEVEAARTAQLHEEPEVQAFGLRLSFAGHLSPFLDEAIVGGRDCVLVHVVRHGQDKGSKLLAVEVPVRVRVCPVPQPLDHLRPHAARLVYDARGNLDRGVERDAAH
mmetsp:Transcript_11145/g.32100  ORF Transcript_11145/g.32100 Transcript_11145/m.32100 type:complete len:223 (-) Transcript_11145:475-1143(-)